MDAILLLGKKLLQIIDEHSRGVKVTLELSQINSPFLFFKASFEAIILHNLVECPRINCPRQTLFISAQKETPEYAVVEGPRSL